MAAEENDVHGLPLPICDASEDEVDTPNTEGLFVHTHVEIEEKTSTVPQATDRV